MLADLARACCLIVPIGLAAAAEAQTVLNPMPSSQPPAAEPQEAAPAPEAEPVAAPAPEEDPPLDEPVVYEAPEDDTPAENIVYSATHGSWSVVCIGGEFNSRDCYTETAVFRRDYTERPVATLRITAAASSPTGLSMALSTPNNVLIQSHANLSIEGSVFVAPYTICDSHFCTAQVDISQQLLGRLLQTRGGFVAFTNPPSSEVFIPLEFGGLLEAITDLNQQLQVSQG